MTKIKAEIVAHSVDKYGNELISVLCTFPRFILAEVNTHRMLSKNTSSSRAIPFTKMVESIQNDPFIPIAWQKSHSGMQGTEYITDKEIINQCRLNWLGARDKAIQFANDSNYNLEVTKQLCNRLLEPFMWTTMLITGSKEGWDNFFHLRCPQYNIGEGKFYKSKKDALKNVQNRGIDTETAEMFTITDFDWLKANKGQAEIHMMALAECIWDAVSESTPKVLQPGEWHIPFQDTFDISELSKTTKKLKIPVLSWEDGEMVKVWVSTAMAARTSYTVVGKEKEIDYGKMIALHDKLFVQNPPHSSPMEHCCVCVTDEEYELSFKGQEKGWFRNYKGFKSYRQIIEEPKF